MPSNKFYILVILSTLLPWLIINDAVAQSTKIATDALSPPTLEYTCKISPSQCLTAVNKALLLATENSRIYYNLLIFKFDALFKLQHTKQLHIETKQWLDKPNLPITFQSTVYIYYAKSAWLYGENAANEKYIALASDNIALMNQAFLSPMRLVVYANLQMRLKEYQAAYQLLSALAEKYPESPDVHFMLELHGNLAHATNQLQQFEEALIHWQNAKKWGELLGNKQQMAVVLYNLADIHFKLSHYELAEKSFIDAITLAQQAKDTKKTNEAKIYLVKTKLKMMEHCSAYQTFLSIDPANLPINSQGEFAKFKETLVPCAINQHQ